MATGGKQKTNFNLLVVGTLTLKPADLDPWDVVVVVDKLVITDSKCKKVRVYRRHDGKLLSSSDTLESIPHGVCSVSDKDFCVAMKDGSIAIMSVQDSCLISKDITFHLSPSFDQCHGVALLNDNIVVCGKKNYTICWCLVSLEDGRPDNVHEVCKGFLNYFGYVTVKDNMVYIACAAYSLDDNGVYGFNLLNPSKPKYTYKNKELWPRGITVDDNGYLFVCDGNSKSIYHLTGNCQLVAIYTDDIPRDPLTIFWDRGNLYLASWKKNVITMHGTPQQGVAISSKTRVDREDHMEQRQVVFGERSASKQTKVSQKETIYRVQQEAKNSTLRPVINIDPVEQVTQTLSEAGIDRSILRRLSKDLICDEWRFFFRELSVTDGEIQQIEFDYHRFGVREHIYQLLRRSDKKGILNKTSILEALRIIGRFDLVTKYAQETFPDS